MDTKDTNNTQKYCAIALTGCALLGSAAMLHHPSLRGHAGEDLAQAMRGIANINRMVHGVMIAVIGALTLCFWQYSASRQASNRFLPASAMICFGIGALSMMMAGLINGFIAPDVIHSSAMQDLPTASIKPLLMLLWSCNQHLTVLGAGWIALAIGLWAIDLWRSSGKRGISIFAGILSLVMLTGLLVSGGHFDVHAMQVFWLAFCLWCATAAWLLWQNSTELSTAN